VKWPKRERKAAAAKPGKAVREVVDDKRRAMAGGAAHRRRRQSRHKKKKSRDGRKALDGGDSDTKHGFEMPTARVVREIAIPEATRWANSRRRWR